MKTPLEAAKKPQKKNTVTKVAKCVVDLFFSIHVNEQLKTLDYQVNCLILNETIFTMKVLNKGQAHFEMLNYKKRSVFTYRPLII